MKTILGKEIENSEECKKTYTTEADVIVTSVVLGFIGTRYLLNQPCRLDHEHPSPIQQKKWKQIEETHSQIEESIKGKDKKDYSEDEMAFVEYRQFLLDAQDFEHVMSAMSYVLDKTNSRIGKFLKDGQSPQWKEGALITGRAGGGMLDHDERHRLLQNSSAIKMERQVTWLPSFLTDAALNKITGDPTLYVGKGAYTGMITDPVGDEWLVQRTKRVIDHDKLWHPGEAATAKNKPWGLITSAGEDKQFINLKELKDGGLGLLPSDVKEKTDIIRYIHGMTSAIVKCVSSGPWCHPFEHASGEQTTKMASCFPCTTYMYATGFPPSSTHLGRGESWVPPKSGLLSGEQIEGDMPKYYNDNITSSLMTRWHWDIYHYLKLGVSYLKNAVAAHDKDQQRLTEAKYDKKVISYVNPDHAGMLNILESILSGYEKDTIGSKGGNLFLDALTVHESDWKRIKQTLWPVYNHYYNLSTYTTEHAVLDRKIASGDILAF
jgi:hypothetical protein